MSIRLASVFSRSFFSLFFCLSFSSWPLSAAAADAAASVDATTEPPVLEELRVIASRLAVRPAGVDVRQLAADAPAFVAQNSLGDALQGHQGITLTNTGGPGKVSALRIRGEEAVRTTVLVDGIELADVSAPQTTTNIHHLVLTPDISRLDVLAGPQAFHLGGDAGGVVNIRTTTPPVGALARLSAEAGSADHLKLAALAGAGTSKAGGVVALQKWRTAGFNSRRDDTVLRDDDGYDNVTVHARGHWQPIEDAAVELVIRHVDATTEFDNCGFPRTDDCVEDYEQTSFRLGATLAGERISHRLSASTSEVDRENLADGAFAFGANGRLNKFEYSLRSSEGPLQFGAGAELRQEDSADRERDQWGVFGEVSTALDNGLVAGLGLRLDDNDDFGTHVTGRAHVAWDAPQFELAGEAANLRLRTSYGTGFRAPSLFEESYNAGPFAFPPASAADLREERSRGVDVGAELRAAGFSLAATVFSQKIEDEIFFDLGGFSGYLQSSGTTKSQGVVLRGSWTRERLQLTADYMYNRARTAAGMDRLRRPRNSGRISAIWSVDAWRLGATMRYAGEVDDEVFGSGRVELSDYAVADLVANWQVRPDTEVFARVTNLFDKSYSDVSGFRAEGTAAYIGVRLDLAQRNAR